MAGDLANLDRRHQSVGNVALLERVLQREAVDHGGEKSHVVPRHAIDPLRRRRHPPDDVAAAHDHRRLHAEFVDFADLVGDSRDDVRLDAERPLPHEGFARQLEENPVVDGPRRHSSDYLRVSIRVLPRPGRPGPKPRSPPRLARAIRPA